MHVHKYECTYVRTYSVYGICTCLSQFVRKKVPIYVHISLHTNSHMYYNLLREIVAMFLLLYTDYCTPIHFVLVHSILSLEIMVIFMHWFINSSDSEHNLVYVVM